MFNTKPDPGSAEYMRQQHEAARRQASQSYYAYLDDAAQMYMSAGSGPAAAYEPLGDDTAELITKDGERIKYKK